MGAARVHSSHPITATTAGHYATRAQAATPLHSHDTHSSKDTSEDNDEVKKPKGSKQEPSAEELASLLVSEVARRRNFAIISHPDAGKTTLVSVIKA